MTIIFIYFFVAIFAPFIAPYGEAQIFKVPYAPWDDVHFFGTDRLGRDILSRLIYGARNTMGIALLTTLLAFVIGGGLGLFSAILRGWVDQILARFVDILMAIPSLIFALMLLSIFGSTALNLIIIIAVLDSTRVFRLSRAVGMNVAVMEYVEAARLRGENIGWIMGREILPNSKSLIGFVGGPWTLLRFATNKKKPLIKIEDFHLGFLNDILIPLLKLNIKLQLNSGAEIVMIFDSGLNDIDSNIFRSKYLLMIEDIAKSFPNKIGYYFKGKELEETKNIFQAPLAGIGINSSVSLKETNSIYTKGFIQGNFDENKMLLDEKNLKDEINLFCDHVKSIKNFNGWVCSLGHGINKATPEKNVHLFIDTIRKKFS